MDDVHPDEAAASADLQDLHLVQEDDAEKSAAPAQDGPVPHALPRRLELLAALAAEPDARGLCTQAVAQFAERSYVARAVAEQPALPEQAARPERSPQSREPLAPKEVRLQSAARDAPAAQSPAKTRQAPMQLEVRRPGAERLEPPEAEPRKLAEQSPLALPPEVQPSWDG